MPNDWLIWQLADSAFPSGSFAHSAGLEAAWQQGLVPDPAALEQFLASALNQCATLALPFVLAGWREPARLADLNRRCEVLLRSQVANRASRAQGESLLSVAERIFPDLPKSKLGRRAREEGGPIHLAPTFGALAARLDLPQKKAGELFLFIALRGWISSAVRLGIVGPIQGQAIQQAMSPLAESLVKTRGGRSVFDAAQTAPVLELLQETHDRLYSTLFQS